MIQSSTQLDMAHHIGYATEHKGINVVRAISKHITINTSMKKIKCLKKI